MNDLTTEFAAAVAESKGDPSSDRILARIGQLTRTLRDSMRELGLDKQVEAAAQAVPDARDRLKYVATMTEQAAERALNSTRARPNGTMRRSHRARRARCSRKRTRSCRACPSGLRPPTRNCWKSCSRRTSRI